MEFQYHEQYTTQVNAQPSRSYYIPFESERFSLEKSKSVYVDLLQKWRFSYFEELPENIAEIHPNTEYDLPFCWQRKGFDVDRYFNFFYPIPFDPPYVRKKNPCGLYETDYFISEKTERYYINFEGVDSCLYLFVNGTFVGYSTVSHSTAEFEITDYLQCGKNTLRAVVFKWCSGTYLEDQDKLRMSGIFREVYILRREREHLRDYKIETKTGGSDGLIHFRADRPCIVSLYDGETLLERQSGAECLFRIRNPRLWNAEEPNLYTLVIHCGREYIREFVGIRTVEIRGAVLQINGKPVKLQGVNRHSSTPNGYVETLADLEQDLKLFKQYNINAVRTSHYPPHPLFTVLCDLYGIYVMEEADLECHGMCTIHYYGDNANRNGLSDDPRWKDVYIHRMERMYERDKNRPSVIIFSMGNEAGWGQNFVAAYHWLKAADSRPVHYEGAADVDNNGWFDDGLLDVYSRMYPSLQDMQTVLDRKITRPFVLCEYTHAMGNSCGDVSAYWEMIDSRDELCGAFVWEWCCHTVEQNGKLLYGGDFGEEDYSPRFEGNFCVDGLVDSDRTVHSSLKEVAQVYAPVHVYRQNDGFYAFNRRSFLSLDDLECVCTVRVNGEVAQRCAVNLSGIAPRTKQKLEVGIALHSGYVTADFVFTKNGGYVCESQCILSTDLQWTSSKKLMDVLEKSRQFSVNNHLYCATIDRDGLLGSLACGGVSLLCGAMTPNVYRVPIDNDLCFADKRYGYRFAYSYYAPKKTKFADGAVVSEGAIVADTVEPIANIRTTYRFFEDRITVQVHARQNDWIDDIPRFGFVLRLNPSLMQAEYFGRGPGEAYEDRVLACPVGKYSDTVRNLYISYTRPQENGSHCGSRYIALDNGKQKLTVRSVKDFSFAVSPYGLRDYRKHAWEMPESDSVYLYIDYRMSGLGSGSCGPATDAKYLLTEREMDFEFEIVLSKHGIDEIL